MRKAIVITIITLLLTGCAFHVGIGGPYFAFGWGKRIQCPYPGHQCHPAYGDIRQ